MECFRELNMLAIVIRMVLCVLCGGALGIERERRHRTAGVKTHILVCMGATICMVTGQYAVEYFKLAAIDPTRIGAQVVSGIGFLGVGTIIVTRNNQVKGLTTAAGLWVSACIGLAIGIGFYEMAVIATVFVLGLLVLVKRFKIMDSALTTGVYVEVKDTEHIKEVLQLIKKANCSVVKMDTTRANTSVTGITLDIHGEEACLEVVFTQLQEAEYVVYFEEFEG